MKEIIKNTLILTLITLIAGICLGFVKDVTSEPIRKQEERVKQEACLEVFADAASFVPVKGFDQEETAAALKAEGYSGEEVLEVLEAKDKEGNLLGHVLTVITHQGYGGDITLSLGVREDGRINGISILSIAETAGLGMKADTPEFKASFAGKQVDEFKVTKTGAAAEGEVDSISGATVTSNAITQAVNAGIRCAGLMQGEE